MSKTWFITGTSSGFGRLLTGMLLARGDHVVGTLRKPGALDDLKAAHGDALQIVSMDLTDTASIRSAIDRAFANGRVDVVVNNAGYGLFGNVEEITEQQLRDQLEVNLFGVLRVTQAVLPILRAQGSGHIVQISTIGGIAAFPGLGGYHASKWALEGLSESLAQEVAGFGIKVTLVEPGGFATDWAGNSAVHATPKPEYDDFRAQVAESRKAAGAPNIGDPKAAGPALLKVVDADQPPLRVLFGTQPTQIVKYLYQTRLDTWQEWEQVSIEANGH
jgi:NAD(P)-dependent dehydrogenase (short-subunit alcohol dehydrogenase family)